RSGGALAVGGSPHVKAGRDIQGRAAPASAVQDAYRSRPCSPHRAGSIRNNGHRSVGCTSDDGDSEPCFQAYRSLAQASSSLTWAGNAPAETGREMNEEAVPESGSRVLECPEDDSHAEMDI